MRSTRLVEVPFELVAAELAASPFTAVTALTRTVTNLSVDMSGATGELWRDVEGRVTRHFPYSIDEITAFRDWLWFGERTIDRRLFARGSHSATGEVVSLVEYLRRLSDSVLGFSGHAFRPRMPPWVNESGQLFDALDDPRARHFWRWMTFTLPPDMLMAAHPKQNTHVSRVESVSKVLSQILADRGYVESHMHLGAAFDFGLAWIASMHAIANHESFHSDSLSSPGAEWSEGRELAPWLLCAVICRYLLAAYLSNRRCDEESATSFEAFLERELTTNFGHPRPRYRKDRDSWAYANEFEQDSCTSLYYDPARLQIIRNVIRAVDSGSITELELLEPARFKRLQEIYRQVTRITRRWPTFPDRYREAIHADPIATFFPARGLGERTSDMEWFSAALDYMDSPIGFSDGLFQNVFWQIARIRCGYYRHITQRPLIPGLQWFLRFYRRLKPLRSCVRSRLLVESAAQLCGEADGLSSMEVRIGPAPNAQLMERELREIFLVFEERSRNLAQQRYINLISSELGNRSDSVISVNVDGDNNSLPSRRVRDSAIEFGVVIHFKRDRGGGMSTGKTKARGVESHGDPSAQFNHGIRYSRYYQDRRQEAFALARVIARYPRVLYYLRGLDISTDELGIPVWVVAPLVRYIRDVSRYASAHLHEHLDEAVPPLRMTVHTGEDFVHLLGGLRRIDEAIDRLLLTQGDRLGHAIALGASATQWAESSSGIAISRIERLFDLAWEWKFSTEKTSPTSANRIQYVIEQIQLLSKAIFGEFAHPTQIAEFNGLLYKELELENIGFPVGPIEEMDEYVASRYDADQRISNDDLVFRSYPERMRIADALRERQDKLGTAGGWQVGTEAAETYFSSFKGRWKAAHGHEAWRFLHRYLSDPATFRRGQVQMLVDPRFEAEALEALQWGLRSKVSRIGLTVEVNPSSNLLIGNLSDLTNHPLWRLKPPTAESKSPSIAVCVGSDDPVTFATSTREEFQLIYDTLTLAGVSDVNARAWLESARMAGQESRFTLRKQIPVADIWIPMDLSLEGVPALL